MRTDFVSASDAGAGGTGEEPSTSPVSASPVFSTAETVPFAGTAGVEVYSDKRKRVPSALDRVRADINHFARGLTVFGLIVCRKLRKKSIALTPPDVAGTE